MQIDGELADRDHGDRELADRDRDHEPRIDARRRLGDLLLSHGLLTEAQLQESLTAQRDRSGVRHRLGQVVVEKGYLTEAQLARALADFFGLDVVDLSTHTLQLGLARLLPRQVAERNRM